MKKTLKFLIITLFFIFLMGGAFVLYQKLSKEYKPDSLLVEGTSGDNDNIQSVENTASGENNENSQAADSADDEAASEAETDTESDKITAPDFTVVDLDGNEVRLSDFTGKPVVLNFWASWCGPCKSEMPDFNEMYLSLGEHVQFLMINVTDGSRETVETASDFVKSEGFSFPVYFDTSYSATYTYGATSLPTTYFISSDGYVEARAVGAIDSETLQKGISLIYSQVEAD